MSINRSEMIRQNYDKVLDEMVKMEQYDVPYQLDLYLYPDGEVYSFTNVGGNSWLDDDHICIWSTNHEYGYEECRDANGDWDVPEDEVRSYCEDKLNSIIEEYEMMEESDKEWAEYWGK